MSLVQIQYNPSYEGFVVSDKRYAILLGGAGCFYPDQLIKTYTGSKKISEIKKGDLVLSYNEDTKKDEYKLCIDTFKYKNNKKLIKVNLKNGSTIIATEDHKFYYRGCYIVLKDLVSLHNGKDMEKNTKL